MLMATIKWHLGHVVYVLRTERGWTQEQLGKKAGGMNKATIVSVESMDRNHGRETYERIANAFGMTVAELWALVPSQETQRRSDNSPTGTAGGRFSG